MHRRDGIFVSDVLTNSSAAWGVKGIDALRDWAGEFVKALQPRIDLVDGHEVIDANGGGRGFVPFNLNWKHVGLFYDLKPTGREGTSIETIK